MTKSLIALEAVKASYEMAELLYPGKTGKCIDVINAEIDKVNKSLAGSSVRHDDNFLNQNTTIEGENE
jgi:hypothetical protein